MQEDGLCRRDQLVRRARDFDERMRAAAALELCLGRSPCRTERPGGYHAPQQRPHLEDRRYAPPHLARSTRRIRDGSARAASRDVRGRAIGPAQLRPHPRWQARPVRRRPDRPPAARSSRRDRREAPRMRSATSGSARRGSGQLLSDLTRDRFETTWVAKTYALITSGQSRPAAARTESASTVTHSFMRRPLVPPQSTFS